MSESGIGPDDRGGHPCTCGGQSLPYYSPIRQALVDQYGRDPSEELNDDNAKSISARMDAKRHEGTWYGEVYHHANVLDVITIDVQPNVDLSRLISCLIHGSIRCGMLTLRLSTLPLR